jgi:hypothetical protein
VSLLYKQPLTLLLLPSTVFARLLAAGSAAAAKRLGEELAVPA